MPEPKVRFKRGDGSSYPAWTVGKLGDITEKVDRKAPKGSTAPVMMVSQGKGFIYQADKYSRENAGQSLKNYTLLKQGEFAYNHGASKAKPYGVAYCLTEEPEARVPFVYHTFRMADGVNPYWHEALNTSKMDRQLKRMVSSGARMDGLLNINYDTYMDVDVNIPCIEEQQKISDFLSSVDEIISTSEQEVANLETQKKAVMKKIFSQEVRFKKADGSDFPEWEEHRIGDICKTYSGGTPKAGNDEYYGGDIPFIRSGEIHSDSTELFLSKTGMNNSSAKMVAIGDIIMALYGATSGEIDISRIEGAINQAILCIMPKEDYDKKYIVEVFRNFKDEILKTYLQGGQGNLSAQIVQGLSFAFPCLEEQRLIADFLSDFDEAIAAAKKELDLWKELKKGLLQQMFV